MNNMKNYIVGAVAIIAFIMAFLAYTKSGQQVVQQLGAVTGPDSYFPVETHNGVTTAFGFTKMSTSSTTVCSFKNVNATSTLTFASARLSTGSTTALQFEWGKDVASPSATTTSLGLFLQTTGASRFTMNASTTNSSFAGGQAASADMANVIAPNAFVNLKYGLSACTPGAVPCNAFVGTCSIKLEY